MPRRQPVNSTRTTPDSGSPHSGEGREPAHFRLSVAVDVWLAAIHAVVTADDRHQPRPEPGRPDIERYVDQYGLRVGDTGVPPLSGRSQFIDTANLVRAAWDARI